MRSEVLSAIRNTEATWDHLSCTVTPDLYVQYFKDLRSMLEAGGALTPAATAEVMGRYATEAATDYASAIAS